MASQISLPYSAIDYTDRTSGQRNSERRLSYVKRVLWKADFYGIENSPYLNHWIYPPSLPHLPHHWHLLRSQPNPGQDKEEIWMAVRLDIQAPAVILNY